MPASARSPKPPAGHVLCVWCGAPNAVVPGTSYPAGKCVKCSLNPMPGEDPTKGGKVDPSVAAKAQRNRGSAPKRGRLGGTPVGKPVMGVDPGARYTGVVVRDGDVVLHSSTLVRPVDMNSTDWALVVVAGVQEIRQEFPARLPMGVEGVNPPTGFSRGKQASLNPKDIIRAGIVLGAVIATWPTAQVVPPGRNGSQHYTHYPAVLIGRRPPDLPGASNGAGTRDHEQSAYDVAGKAANKLYPREYPLRIA